MRKWAPYFDEQQKSVQTSPAQTSVSAAMAVCHSDLLLDFESMTDPFANLMELYTAEY